MLISWAGVRDKKKAIIYFHVNILSKSNTHHDATMKGWGFSSIPGNCFIIVESYDDKHVDMGSNCDTCFKHRPDSGLDLIGTMIILHIIKAIDKGT